MDGTTLAPGPRDYIFAICKRWMDPNGDGDPSDGIDGWRLDTVLDVPIGFWTEWNTYIRSINPDIYTVAEIWSDASSALSAGRFSATMNYAGCAIPVYDYLTRATSTPSQFAGTISLLASTYGSDVALANQNLVDSHDTERLLSMIVNAPVSTGFQTINNPRASSTYSVRKPNDRERAIQRLIALAQMTIPGAPMIYYGDEAGMWGANDPDDRMPMPWPDQQFALQATDPRGVLRVPDNVNFDSSVAAYYRSAIALRHRFISLRRGIFQIAASNDSSR
jgi:cyclomaltodextrinase